MSNRPPTLKDCFKVKKGLCVTGDAYITGSLTISGDFAWMNPDALLTVGNLATNDLSASRLHSNNVEVIDMFLEPDITITHPISVVDEAIFEQSVVMHEDLWIKGDLRVDGNAYLSAGIGGRIDVGDTNTDSVVFNADIQSPLIPDNDIQYDLGTSEQQWRELYVQDISGTRDLNINRYVNFSGLSGGGLSGKFISFQSDSEITTSTLVVDEVSRATTKVNNTSADWDSVYSSVCATSSEWDSVYSSVCATSAEWDSVYTDVSETSGEWDSVYSSVCATSSEWDSVYSSVCATSAEWDSVYTDVSETSGEWDSVYSWVNSDSATNNSNYNQTAYVNASGDSMTGDLNMGSSKIITTKIHTGDDSKILTLQGGSNNTDGPQLLLIGGDNVNPNISNRIQLNADNVIIGDVFDSNYQPWVLHVDVDSQQVMLGGLNALNNSDISLYGHTTVSGDILPHTTTDYDIGSTTHQWKHAYVQDVSISRGLTVSGDTMTSDLTVSGAVIVDSVSSDIIPTLDSAFSLGVANSAWSDIHTDKISTGELIATAVVGDLIPKQNMSSDIGSPAKHWMDIYTHNLSAHANIYTHNLSAHGDITSTGTTSLSTLSLSADTTTPVLRVSQLGSGNAVEIVDQTDPDNTPVVINSTGKVGIGTTTPTAKLDVAGVSKFSRASTGNQPSIVVIENTATGATATPALSVVGDMVATGSISAAGDIYAANHSLVFSDGNPDNDTTWSKNDAITGKRVANEWDGIHENGSLTIPVSSYIQGDIKVDGDVTLGQSESVILVGKVGSDIIPKLNKVYTLGSTDSKFGTGHFESILTTELNTESVSGGTFYFAPSSEDNNAPGGSPSTETAAYSAEREFTYTDVVSSRDTSTVVQTNSAAWAEQVSIPEQIHVMTRGSIGLTTQDGEPEFIAIASDNPAGDAIWNDVTYAHAMVVPYNTTVKRVILRASGSQGANAKVSVHSNEGVEDTNTPEYKYFAETPLETVEQSFTDNNSSRVFMFSNTTSAAIGNTIGISVSATQPLNATNISIVLQYQDPDA